MKKIALLFLSRQDLNHPRFWQNQLTKAKGMYSVYIHSKRPLEDPFFKKFRIDKIVETSWKIHIAAWMVLLEKALRYTHNQKFVFVSESCLPLYPLKMLADYLLRDDTSYMGYAKPWWDKDNSRHFPFVDQAHHFGNHEWVILNRKHAKMILEDQTLFPKIKNIPHSHEAYFATFFATKGLLKAFGRNPTYAVFDKKNPDGTYPYEFHLANDEEWKWILNGWKNQSFFMRKFAKTFPKESIDEIMDGGRKIGFPD